MLLGIPSGSRSSFAYGGVTLCADAFQASSATQTISYFLPDQQLWLAGPTTPITQRLPAMTRDRFGLFPFRSPLLRESLLLSLPVGTEMFHFPTLPPPALCVQAGATGHYAQSGFPIRRSPDRSLVADSPGLIAGSYVLLRLSMPRHPPCALRSLSHKYSTKTAPSLAPAVEQLVHYCCYKDRSLSPHTDSESETGVD